VREGGERGGSGGPTGKKADRERGHTQYFLIDALPSVHFKQSGVGTLEEARGVGFEENSYDRIQERLLHMGQT